ncbi:solute carrier family 3 member 2a [Gouania willdenowi]|uniref:Glycosyl hydrolase family 13 catalytic domain-containing protein n=1 Tax=Gouania willdenowi TaxID=441366 RepID=A0A8C5IBM5_GOUWI|nr:4F2 cell-surface antigen heavy chain [Gouania willdenowi]
MSKDTEIDMKEVELNELDLEKQPMTGDGQAAAGEKNGSVKLKVPEDEVAFTGLSKEELMRVAGTRGWVRTRWALLILFWLGWVGMLAGAVVIIVQAPRCKPLPEMNWWNEGPLYQIPDIEAFAENLEGVEAKLDNMNQLKVKGLVLGPLHTVQADQPITLKLKEVDPKYGKEEHLKVVLDKAQKKGMSVILDLTPNYHGANPWFTADHLDDTVEEVKVATEHWLKFGVDGIKISDLTIASRSLDWDKLQAAVVGNRTDDTKKKLLMGAVQSVPTPDVALLVNTSGVDLILSDLLSSNKGGVERIRAFDDLNGEQRSVGWGLGAAGGHHLATLANSSALIRLYQLMLFTLPGTPVFTYGDEIGLQAEQGAEYPKMIWDIDTEPASDAPVDEAAEAMRKERVAVRKWFKTLSDLRGKERSLLYGDYYSLYSSASSLAYLRLWDQSERFVTVVNWGEQPEKLTLKLTPTEGVELPQNAKVRFSTDEDLAEDSTVSLEELTLNPGQAVLLQFPYTP